MSISFEFNFMMVNAFAASVALLLGSASACTNYMVTRGASADNSTQIAYNSDGQSLYGFMTHLPAGDHAPNAQRKVYEFTSGVYLGSIPEAPHTYNVIGNTNEHQLTIAETTFDGLKSLAEPYNGSILDYYSLMWITLQRTRTAREAIKLMDELTQKYGYASTGESFSIADTKEVWIMEMIGKGKEEKGSVWVARRVPDGAVCGHANQARIQQWPRNDPDAMYANDTVAFARRMGLYPAEKPDEAFSFSDTFDPISVVGARACELRVWNWFRLALGATDGAAFADSHLAYVQGKNLTQRMPLWVHVGNRKIDVNQTMWAMRERYRGTYFDQRSDVGAGPFHSEIRVRPTQWSLGKRVYTNERNVGYQGTFFNFVSQGRGWLPDVIGALTWFGVDDAAHMPRVPMYANSKAAPETYAEGNGNTTTFEMRSAYWIHNLVANLVYSRYDLIGEEVKQRIIKDERRYFEDVRRIDAQAARLLSVHGEEAVKDFLTKFSTTTADSHVDDWIQFWQHLTVKYRDGLVVSPGAPPAKPQDKPQPANAKAQGYDDKWYTRIVKETKDHYLIFPMDGAAAEIESAATERDMQKMRLVR